MRLHYSKYKRLARDHLKRIVFHNDPHLRFMFLPPMHRQRLVRALQYAARVLLAPFLWLKEFTVLDPNGKYVLWMSIDDDESRVRGERALVIEVANIRERLIQSGLWAFRDPGYWHCFDSHTVALTSESLDTYRKQYLSAFGFDPIERDPADSSTS